MAYTTRTGPQGAAVARAYVSYLVGMCLNFVWRCLDMPVSAGLVDANAAWAAAKVRHSQGTPPVGAPVYWGGGKHGHIAISLGGGFVQSTDWPAKGKVGRVDIETLTREWNLVYRGWSEDYAGRVIRWVWNPPVPAAPTNLSIRLANVRPGKRNDDVRRFKALLWRKVNPQVRQRYWDRWAAEDASTLGPVAQDLLYDLYAWLHTAKGWSRVNKVGGVWPGRQLVKYLGGKPV